MSFLLLLCPAESETLVRPEGSAINYYVERPVAERFPLAVILQGSECLRVSDKFGPYREKLLADGVGVLRIEKPGLHPGVEPGDCPDEYLRTNTPQRRVLDLVMVVAHLRSDPAWDGRLVLIGGSEGAMIAAMAAPLFPETRGVVLLSGGGGMTFGEEVVQGAGRQMAESGMESAEVEKEMEAMRGFLAGLAKESTPYKEWGSDEKLARNTYLWWAHASQLRLSTPLSRVDAPILILHGRDDLGTPFRSAEILTEELLFNGRTRVELRPYEGGHSPPEEKILEALDWVSQRLK